VAGAKEPDAFADEIFGNSFALSLPGLAAGKYALEIDMAEVYHKDAGGRVMTITCGGRKLAENLDIFAAAGGFAKAYCLRATVDHAAGPLTIAFTASQDKAKFNAIRVLDDKGTLVASAQAREFTDVPDVAGTIPDIKDPVVYTNPDAPLDARVDDLVRRMTLKEKVSQLVNGAPAIDRLNVPAYDYWNECLHGVARAGHATVFPQAIGMAATWDTPLIHTIGDTIATEARAKYYEAIRRNHRAIYYGLDFWTPNINLFRDPRWGRGQETYGEDPFLTGRIGVAFITGLQGDDPHYLKAMACAKHFAVHSGPESDRHHFNVDPSERDLYESYLPQFEAAVREAHVGNIMSAYNAVYGEPCSSSKLLLEDILRKKWGFDGHVVSDCDAVGDIRGGHHKVNTTEEAAARAVLGGCDLNCGGTYKALARAVAQKLLTEADIDTVLHRVLRCRFRLGLFDPAERVPFSNIPFSENDSPTHGAVALQAARESIVLLKNSGVLPLDKAKLKRVAVLGANANSTGMLLANYNGDPTHPVTILQGIKDALGEAVQVDSAQGCPLALPSGKAFGATEPEFKKALELAAQADVVIYVGGLTASLEGEEMRVNADGFSGGDRTKIELPAVQTGLLQALAATGKPVIFVNCSGSAMALPWESQNLPAIVQAWYPGQAGGTAVAEVLFGAYNPAGRLPVTFYQSTADLPDFRDYAMANRTYRYFTGKPLYAFGHGLSYTTFEYAAPTVAAATAAPADVIHVTVPVKNTGTRDGQEVVQAYARQLNPTVPQPIHSLAAFQRVTIAQGQNATVTLDIPASRLRYWDVTKKDYVVAPGEYEIQIGASSTDIRGTVKVTIK